MKREFLIDRQGRSFVLYAGLLDEAHGKGLKAIRTKLVQAPAPENGETTICLAEVEMEDGRLFSGIGDATPQNVGRTIVPHAIRMAETRAKARALRDALNIGAAALEELADLDDAEPAHEQRAGWGDEPRRSPQSAPPAQSAQQAPRAPTPIPQRPPTPQRQGDGYGDVATPAQVRAIYLIGRDQHSLTDAQIDERSAGLYGAPPAELTKKQASNLITVLKGGA